MTETLRYALIGKQDIRRGLGTFEVELADGRVVTLDELGVEVPSSALASLPPAGTANRLAVVTDDRRGIHKDNATNWGPIYPILNIEDFPGATAGARIADALAGLPSSGGVIDARSLTGAQTISANPFAGVTKRAMVLLGAATYSVSATIARTSGQHLVGIGARISTAAGEPAGAILRWTGAAEGTLLTFPDAASTLTQDLELDANSSAAITAHISGTGVVSPWGNTFLRVRFFGDPTNTHLRLGSADTADVAFTLCHGCSFRGGKAQIISDATNASWNRVEDSQFFGTANTDYNIRINRGSITLGGHTYFSGAVISDVFFPSAGSLNQAFTAKDTYSESTTPFMTMGANAPIGGIVYLDNVKQNAGAGNSITYDSGAQLVIVGSDLQRAVNLSANAINILSIGNSALSFTGTTSGLTRLDENGLQLNGGTIVTGHLSATATLDFGAIAANTTADLTITVTGAAAGDTAIATPNGLPSAAGLVWSATVTAADTVTVRMANVTVGALDPASQSWRADVWKH